MRYVIKVAYDGTDYCGWQVQDNGATVQEKLNGACEEVFNCKSVVTASGRTDAGVHALGQVCHVDTQADISIDPERLADALNAHLPPDIGVLASALAPEGFDANRSAKKKTYLYKFYSSPRRNPLWDRYAAQVKGRPDIELLREGAELFVGEHDFKAYCASGSAVLTTVRTVYSFTVYEKEGLVCAEVCGNGFLYNMVRTLVGTVVDYACGKLAKQDIINSLERGDRSLVGKTMPAKGLTLLSVDYGIRLF